MPFYCAQKFFGFSEILYIHTEGCVCCCVFIHEFIQLLKMKCKVLVIDDDEMIRTNVVELLDLAGYETIEAPDGKKGLEMINLLKPDLILCDISMPLLDGYGVLHAIQNNPEWSPVPFIFITANTKRNSFRAAMDNGADDYLSKPFTGDELIKLVHTHLEKFNRLKSNFNKSGNGTIEFNGDLSSLVKNEKFTEKQTIRKFFKKEYIYHEGDKAEYLYQILDGKVKVSRMNESGKEFITDLFNHGDFFGYQDLLTGEKHKESAVALEDAKVALVSKHDFLNILQGNPEIAITFLKSLTENLNSANDKLLGMAYDSARKKVAQALIFINKKYQLSGGNDICFPIQREVISSIAGLSPESVSRNLTELNEEGLIKTDNRTIRIVDLKKLEDLKW